MTNRPRVRLPVTVLAVVLAVGCGAPSAAPPVPAVSSPATTTAGPPPASTASSPPASTALPSTTADPSPTRSTPVGTTQPSPSAAPSSTDSTPPTTSCADLSASLTVRQRVGQLFMVGVESGGLTARDEDVLGDGDVGSVIFLQNSTAGATAIRRLVEDVRDATKTPHGIDTMITVDQEGGQVQRLRGPGFDRIPSARVQERLSDSELAEDAETWARQLKQVGVDADLAPVADVVPTRFEKVNRPIARLDRGYGPDRQTVARKVTAFVRGMHRAGIATSVKHFPGLGRVRGNTDFSTHVVDSSTTRRDPDLQGFGAGVTAGVDMVMVSTAFYDKIDPAHQAAFSSLIITDMIRGDLHFDGVVISDDLAARAVSTISPGTRAVRFLRAGGDLAIVGNAGQAPAMIKAVLAEADADPAFANELTAKATRVLTMKDQHGLADCG